MNIKKKNEQNEICHSILSVGLVIVRQVQYEYHFVTFFFWFLTTRQLVSSVYDLLRRQRFSRSISRDKNNHLPAKARVFVLPSSLSAWVDGDAGVSCCCPFTFLLALQVLLYSLVLNCVDGGTFCISCPQPKCVSISVEWGQQGPSPLSCSILHQSNH